MAALPPPRPRTDDFCLACGVRCPEVVAHTTVVIEGYTYRVQPFCCQNCAETGLRHWSVDETLARVFGGSGRARDLIRRIDCGEIKVD